MKHVIKNWMLFSVLVLSVPAIADAQKINFRDKNPISILPEVGGVVKYTEVVTVEPGLSQTELADRAKTWFITNYDTTKNKLQKDVRDSGIVIGKGSVKGKHYMRVRKLNVDTGKVDLFFDLTHTIKIFTKKGEFRYEIGELEALTIPFTVEGTYVKANKMVPANRGFRVDRAYQMDLLNEMDRLIQGVILSLKEGMLKPAVVKHS